MEAKALAGKTAVVTGASSGIGQAIAEQLGAAGAHVTLGGRTRAAMEATARAIEKAGGTARVVVLDVRDLAQVRALVDGAVAETGRLDILVNNAGMAWAAPTLEYPLAGWDRVFDLNVRGLFLLSQRVARHMKEAGGGSIINLASISAFSGSREEEQPVVAYPASKAAVIALTRDMAVKLAPHGIRVNAIAPGPFLTDMMNHVRHDPAALRAFEARVPLRRSGGEDDAKGAVVYLASNAAAFVTGTVLVVDGGVSACG